MPKRKDKLVRAELPDSAFIWNEEKNEWDFGWLNAWRRQKSKSFIDQVTFDNNTTSKTSDSFYCAPYTLLRLFIDLAVTSTPTDITIDLEFSPDNERWYKHMNGPWGSLMYEDSAGDKKESIITDIDADYCRVKVTATGTDASNKFKLSLDATFSG